MSASATTSGHPVSAAQDGGDPQPPDTKRPRLALSKEKLHTLHGAVRTKTAFQRQKEEMEERQRKEEEERAKVFSEFVSSFDDDPSVDPHDKTFVRSARSAAGRNQDDRERIFRPLAPPPLVRPGSAAAPTAPPSMEKEYQPEAPMISNPLRKRKLDELVESFKQNGPSSNRSDAQYHASTLGALHLPFSSVSTNVFVGNLNPSVTEDVLCSLFAQFGPIASVKIMWPRTKEELSRGHHSGFVCFMNRASAQRAFSSMQGQTLQGFPMRLDWGKPVALPATPFYVSPEQANASSSSTVDPNIGQSSSPSTYQVTIPDDPLVLTLIHQTIQRVLEFGSAFESLLLIKNKDNPTFAFLTDCRHPYHLYYKWRTYSLLQGDSTTRWNTNPFRIYHNDPVEWIPPPCLAALDDEDPLAGPDPPESDEDVVGGGEAAGSRSVRLSVVRRLRALCYRYFSPLPGARNGSAASATAIHPTRAMVARVTALCIASSDAATNLAGELARMVTNVAPPPNGCPAHVWQLNLLYVLHDVLVNSTAPMPNAWRYREAIQAELPAVFDRLGDTYAKLRGEAEAAGGQSRWAADAWRSKVLAVVSCWRIGMVYAREFVSDLEARVKGPWAAVQAAAARSTSGGAQTGAAGEEQGSGGHEVGEGKSMRDRATAVSGTTANWVAVGGGGVAEVQEDPSHDAQNRPTLATGPSRPKAGGLTFSLGRR